jgi:phosphoribosylformylglycinamidine cyclo-ligase
MKQSAYKDAGVDIDAGDALVDRIKPLAKTTNRAGNMGGIGGFGAFFDVKAAGFKDPVIVSSTDGVGTKLKIAIETGHHATIGIDLVAMCVNDILVQGAEPLFFLDYFATGKLDITTAEQIISGIAEGCRQSNCALIGGETAEMPGMYGEGDYDLAGFAVGAVERDAIITGEHIQENDVVIGISSSGVHSNGYSLVRKIVRDAKLTFNDPAPFSNSQTLGEILLTPTKIYTRQLMPLIKEPGLIKGMAHITGGGLLDNIPRVLPDGLGVKLDARSWEKPPVFAWLQSQGGVDATEMARTLNCGIGMIVITDAANADKITSHLTSAGEKAAVIGAVTKASGSERVQIDNLEAAWASA